MQRREDDDCARRILNADVYGQRSRGRQRKRWIDIIKYDLKKSRLTAVDARIVLNGEGETVWLTPYQRDLQSEGETETELLMKSVNQDTEIYFVLFHFVLFPYFAFVQRFLFSFYFYT